MAMAPTPIPRALDDYLPLLHDFVDGRIDGETFERRFLKLYQDDGTFYPEPAFATWNGFFWAIEDFYADPTLRDPGGLDEDQLRERVRAALATLQQIISLA